MTSAGISTAAARNLSTPIGVLDKQVEHVRAKAAALAEREADAKRRQRRAWFAALRERFWPGKTLAVDSTRSE